MIPDSISTTFRNPWDYHEEGENRVKTMKMATEAQMTEGNCTRASGAMESQGLQKEIDSISNTWTNHPNCICFLKIFSGYQGSWGNFTSDHSGGPLGGCLLKDPRKTHFSKPFSAQLSLSIKSKWFIIWFYTDVRKTHRISITEGTLEVNLLVIQTSPQEHPKICLIRTSLDMGG